MAPHMRIPCMPQAYPTGGGLADAMAANELAAHCSLKAEGDGQHVCSLIGGFASEQGATAGEQVPPDLASCTVRSPGGGLERTMICMPAMHAFMPTSTELRGSVTLQPL